MWMNGLANRFDLSAPASMGGMLCVRRVSRFRSGVVELQAKIVHARKSRIPSTFDFVLERRLVQRVASGSVVDTESSFGERRGVKASRCIDNDHFSAQNLCCFGANSFTQRLLKRLADLGKKDVTDLDRERAFLAAVGEYVVQFGAR